MPVSFLRKLVLANSPSILQGPLRAFFRKYLLERYLRENVLIPHYVAEYRKLVSQLTASHALDEAMSLAVGGDYEDMGNIQADLLHEWGLKDGHFVIDIGCGSGRLASALQKRSTEIQYLGTNIIPELLGYGKTKALRIIASNCPLNSAYRRATLRQIS